MSPLLPAPHPRRGQCPPVGESVPTNRSTARGFRCTHADVIAAASQEADGVLIDFTSYGMGTIFLKNFQVESLSPGDIWL